MKSKMVEFFAVILLGSILISSVHSLGQDGKDSRFVEPPTPALRMLYLAMGDSHTPQTSIRYALSAYPAEIREELMRIICLESQYYDANVIGSTALRAGSAIAAEYFGHEDKFYKQLKILIKTANSELINGGKPLSEENKIVCLLTHDILDGLGKNNMHDGALTNFVDLIDSGLVGPDLPKTPGEQFYDTGSRAEAYIILMARYKDSTEKDKREKIIGFLRHLYQKEFDERVKKNMEKYLGIHGLFQVVTEMRNEDRIKPDQKQSNTNPLNIRDYKISKKPVDESHVALSKGEILASLFGLLTSICLFLIWRHFNKPEAE